MSIDGILPIYKECDLRSTDCVSQVKKILPRGTKIGHAGTLDSTAEGLLLLLIGRATRLADFIMTMPKVYRAVVHFGVQTSTDDASGEVVATKPANHITDDLIDEILPAFLGTRSQVPPNISAVHINGKRAHDLTRSGSDFKIQPKNIKILRIGQISKLRNNEAEFLIECKKGTYIRSFARDLGFAMGTVAHINFLRREKIWKFEAKSALSSKELPNLTWQTLEKYVLNLNSLVGFLPTFQLDTASEQFMRNGLDSSISNLNFLSLGDTEEKNKVLLISDSTFSICDLRIKNNVAHALPKCNIFL